MDKLLGQQWPAGPPSSTEFDPYDIPDAEADAFVHRELVEAARDDVNAFCTHVLRDELTGIPLEQAPVHEAWHRQADEHDRLLIWSAIEHGKTWQLSIGRSLFELGKNPKLRIAIVSNTAHQAEKVMRPIKRLIESSAELHEVFPGLRPADLWTSRAITVQRKTMSKDPSIQTLGIHGNVLGSRIDLLVIDDLLDLENTGTQKSRDDCFAWVRANLLSRLTEKARVLVVGTAFHPDDTLHKLAGLPGWKALRYPALTESGQPRWPERWSLERLSKKRDDVGPLEFARQLMCVARSDEQARFKRAWIDQCLALGEGKTLTWGLNALPAGFKTYTGVDLAVQQRDGADFTSFFTIAVHPHTGNREVLNVETGRWAGPEIVQRIIDHHRRYMSICVVENNAAQDFIVQFARGSFAVPIRPFTTGRNKAHPEFGVESIAAEMAGKKWIIPSRSGSPAGAELHQWVQDMLYYDPREHTPDRLMASWFAREGARLGNIKVETSRLDLTAR